MYAQTEIDSELNAEVRLRTAAESAVNFGRPAVSVHEALTIKPREFDPYADSYPDDTVRHCADVARG